MRRLLKTFLGLAACLSLIGGVAEAHQERIGVWNCKVTSNQICDPKGCARGEVTRWSRIDFNKSSYALCTSHGCAEYPARIIQRPGLITIDVVSKGLVGRIVSYDQFVEVATTGVEVNVSRGVCAF